MKEGDRPNWGSHIPPSSKEGRRRRFVRKILRPLIKHPLAFTNALLTIVGGGYGIHTGINVFNDKDNNPPPATRDIASVPGDTSFSNDGSVPQLEGLPPLLEQPTKLNEDKIFDNEAATGVITERMIKRVPQEEIEKLDTFAKLGDDSNKTIVTLAQPKPPRDLAHLKLPDIQVEIGDDKATIEILYPLDLRLSSNPNAEIVYTKSYTGSNGTDRQAFQGKGYYDTYEFKGKGNSAIPKGTIVKRPVDSYVVVNKEGYVFLYVQAPNGNKYSMLLFGEKEDKVVPFKLLVDAPERTPEFSGKPIGSFGLFGSKGKASFETTQELDKIHIRILSAAKRPVEGGNVHDTVYIPTNVILFVSPEDKELLASEQ